jgi:aspartyl-tRNA(Asn)/glutamyl-tRNA(Gln) amidotransferase subunit B
MEKGQMRFDININLEITDDDGCTFYTPIVEVKNLNSFRSLERAINFEADFQFEEFKKNRIEKNKGNKVTKGWNDIKGETIFQRGKEESDDYRYFPEPDLPPLVLSQKFIDSVTVENSAENTMKKLRDAGVSGSSVSVLVLTLGLEFVHIFDQMSNEYHGDLNSLANWVINDLAGIISEYDVDISSIDIQKLVNILNLVSGKELTSTSAKEIIYKMIVNKENVDKLISSRKIISDNAEIDKCIDEVLGENKDLIQTYLNGKEGLLSFFIGQVMKKMQGRASPSDIKNKLLIKISKFR